VRSIYCSKCAIQVKVVRCEVLTKVNVKNAASGIRCRAVWYVLRKVQPSEQKRNLSVENMHG
jgi:hypothetical protein